MLQSRGSQRVGHDLVTGQQQQPTRNIISPSSMPTVLTASPSHKLCSPFGHLSWAVRRCRPAAPSCPCYLCPLFLLNSLLSAILCVWKFSSSPRADCHKFQPGSPWSVYTLCHRCHWKEWLGLQRFAAPLLCAHSGLGTCVG